MIVERKYKANANKWAHVVENRIVWLENKAYEAFMNDEEYDFEKSSSLVDALQSLLDNMLSNIINKNGLCLLIGKEIGLLKDTQLWKEHKYL